MKILLLAPHAARGGVEKSVEIYSQALEFLNIRHEICFDKFNHILQINNNLSYLRRNGFTHIIVFKNFGNCFYLKFFTKCKVYVRSSNTPILLLHERSLKRLVSEILKLITYSIGADIIISNSIENGQILKKIFPFNSVRTIVNYNNIKFNIDQTPKLDRFLWIGRFEHQKAPILVLHAYRIYQSFGGSKPLHMYGAGSQSIDLQRFTTENNLNVKFHNFSDAHGAIQLGGIAIFSSKYEGLPNILLEYVGRSLPIIYNKCKTGVDEILNVYPSKYEYDFQSKDSLAFALLNFDNTQYNFTVTNEYSKEFSTYSKITFIKNLQSIL